MPLVSLTRLKLRSWLYMPSFLWHTFASTRQLKRAAGLQRAALGRDPSGAFWTVTLWRDEASMRAYRNSGAHMRAMPRLIRWCDEASVAHWEADGADLPHATELLARMRSEGRTSKVRNPSEAHRAKQTAPNELPPSLSPVV